MARSYQLGLASGVVNTVMTAMLRAGLGSRADLSAHDHRPQGAAEEKDAGDPGGDGRRTAGLCPGSGSAQRLGARYPARHVRKVGLVLVTEAAQEQPLLPGHDPREGGALEGQPRPDSRAAVEQRPSKPGDSLSGIHRIT